MSDPVLPNKDAEWLWQLGAAFIDDDDLETGMRLQQLAVRHQNFDDRILSISTNGEYEAGKKAAYLEYYGRSNLPEELRAMPADARRLGVGVKIQRIPTGKTSAQVTRKKREVEAFNKKYPALAGLKVSIKL